MISIIICSINPDRFRQVCEMYAQVFAGENCQVVGVHDARGLAEGYNRAVSAAKGDLLIFSHDDVLVLNTDFKDRLLGHMRHADLVGIAGATRVTGGAWAYPAPPYVFGQIAHWHPEENRYYAGVWGVPARRVDGIKVMDGVFLCAKRAVLEKVSFDDKAFTGFHVYDLDFTFRAYLAGFRLAVGCDLCVLHGSTGNWDERWKHFEDIFRLKHFGRLDVMPTRKYRAAMVGVDTREDLLQVMNPPWWDWQ